MNLLLHHLLKELRLKNLKDEKDEKADGQDIKVQMIQDEILAEEEVMVLEDIHLAEDMVQETLQEMILEKEMIEDPWEIDIQDETIQAVLVPDQVQEEDILKIEIQEVNIEAHEEIIEILEEAVVEIQEEEVLVLEDDRF